MSKKYIFKTEVQQLLHLVIHSLYSNRDIFLRELIANANDAVDKCRFEALSQPELNQVWQIRITPDTEKNTLTISDNGIGMTLDEMIANLGTIAKSGTKAFVEQLKSTNTEQTPDLIGQFGVGFYSAFMAADTVEVISRKAGTTQAHKWVSDGNSNFTTDTAERDCPGTDVILFLKEDAKDYTTTWRIKEIVSKYANFVEHPIVMQETKKVEEKEVVEDIVLNAQKAIWRRNPTEVTEEEYQTFYKHLDHFAEKSLSRLHFNVEGATNFSALLYISEKAPFDFFYPNGREHGLQLYVKRVFITDACKELIPEYLRFTKGVVESNDLPLNVSREILQDNAHIRAIAKALTRKILGELQSVLDNRYEDYVQFYESFGRLLKEGLRTDYIHADKIKDLLLFESLNSEDGKKITLKAYVEKMPENQKEILYFLGESRKQILASPLLEQAKKSGFDVLFMTDTIDELISGDLSTYADKPFKGISKGTEELSDDDKKTRETQTAEFKSVIDFLTENLKNEVNSVRVTGRLSDSPACLVRETFEQSAQLERFLRSINQPVPETKPALEINPNHPLIQNLNFALKAPEQNAHLADFALLILDQAMITEGSPLPDPAGFAQRLTALMTKELK